MKLPVGIDDFSKIINNGYDIVDKTLFIKEIIEDNAEVILITRPRRFGKTINMSMLYYFLGSHRQDNSNIVKKLEIAQHKELCGKHQNKYPIIFITFKSINDNNYQEAEKSISNLVSGLYLKFKSTVWSVLDPVEQDYYKKIESAKADRVEIKYSISRLSSYLHRATNVKPYILIDEYDTPIHSGYVNNYYQNIIVLMQGIFGEALKGNRDLNKAVLTGITKISAESLFSDVNNMKSYNVFDQEYSQYFGFTETEVDNLIIKSKCNVDSHSIKDWYNGYIFGNTVIYNPWSIINCLSKNGLLRPYWINTSQNALIRTLINNSGAVLKNKLEKMLMGDCIQASLEFNLAFPDLQTKESAIWSLFLYAGYLKAESSDFKTFGLEAKISIPNREISYIYKDIVKNWFKDTLNYGSYQEFINSLINGNLELFENFLKEYICESGSYFDFNKNTKEQVFHVFILGLVVGLREDYLIKSNQESGYGRFDVAFVPYDKTKNGILLEFKIADKIEDLETKANEGLKQILSKQYTNIFKEHDIKNICVIGIAFCGRQLKLVSKNITN